MLTKRTKRRAAGALLVGGLIFVLIGVGGYLTTQRSLSDAGWVTHTQEVIASIDEIQAGMLSAESSARGYVLTDNEAFLGVYADAIGRLPERIVRLDALVQDNPTQRRNVVVLSRLVDARLVQIDELLHSYRKQGLDGARAAIARGVFQTSSSLRRQVQTMTELERQQLIRRNAATTRSAQWVLWVTVIGIASGLLVMLLAYRLLSRELERRTRAEDDASRTSERLIESFAALERTSAGLEALARYSGLLQNCRDAEEALEITARTIAPLIPGAAGAVYLLRASRDRAEQVVAWGEMADDASASIAPDNCWALRRDRTHVVMDAGQGMLCQHAGVNLPAHAATACIPLSAQGTQLGMLALRSEDPDDLASLTVAEAAAEQLSLALHNLRLRETLRQQSIRDPLTGLYNRRYLEETLSHELARPRAGGHWRIVAGADAWRRHLLPVRRRRIDDHPARSRSTNRVHDGGEIARRHRGPAGHGLWRLSAEGHRLVRRGQLSRSRQHRGLVAATGGRGAVSRQTGWPQSGRERGWACIRGLNASSRACCCGLSQRPVSRSRRSDPHRARLANPGASA